MKTTMIAALVAAQLSAAAFPARAAGQPGGDVAAQPATFEERAELALADRQAQADPRADAAQEEEPRKKKRKSTGDKVLTGAAVILGVGALAVGGLLIAIFAS